MGKAGACKVCERPDRAEIEARLASGESRTSVSRATGIPESTIRVHQKRCARAGRVAPVPPPPGELPALALDPADPLKALIEAHHRDWVSCQQLWQEAINRKDERTAALHAQQLRGFYAAEARLLEKVERIRPPERALREHPDWLRSVLAGAVALDPFPEARAAFLRSQEEIVGPLSDVLPEVPDPH